MIPIGIVIPTMNNYQGLIKLINSCTSKFGLLDFYIVDNTIDNKGVAKSWNEGLQHFENRKSYIMFIGDDCILRNTIDDLLYEFLNNSNKKIILSSSHGISPDSDDYRSVPSSYGGDYSCFMVANKIQDYRGHYTKFSDLVGYFDENFYPAYFEDNDMDYRIKLLKYESWKYGYISHIHEGSHTLNSVRGTPEEKIINDGYLKNQDYYKKKWGGLPGSETYITPFNKKDE